MRFSLRTHTADVRCRDRTYDLSLHDERMVTVWQENHIFTKCPIAPVFRDLELFWWN
jgi:hypothetical protein